MTSPLIDDYIGTGLFLNGLDYLHMMVGVTASLLCYWRIYKDYIAEKMFGVNNHCFNSAVLACVKRNSY